MIERTRMFSETAGMPGRSAQAPRTIRSISTPRLRGAVQGPDDLRLDQRVHLRDDAGGLAVRRAPRFLVDVLQHPVVQGERRLEQSCQPRGPAEPGKLHEDLVHVLPDLRIRGQQSEVGVCPGGAGVVVARAEVDVAAQLLPFAADHEQHLRVGLVPDDPIDDVRAGLLELLGERDVRLFVEAGPQLDAYRDFLAGAGRRDERVDERRFGPGAVERLLDGQHVGVGGGLLDEFEHRANDWKGWCRRTSPAAIASKMRVGGPTRAGNPGVNGGYLRSGRSTRSGNAISRCRFTGPLTRNTISPESPN